MQMTNLSHQRENGKDSFLHVKLNTGTMTIGTLEGFIEFLGRIKDSSDDDDKEFFSLIIFDLEKLVQRGDVDKTVLEKVREKFKLI